MSPSINKPRLISSIKVMWMCCRLFSLNSRKGPFCPRNLSWYLMKEDRIPARRRWIDHICLHSLSKQAVRQFYKVLLQLGFTWVRFQEFYLKKTLLLEQNITFLHFVTLCPKLQTSWRWARMIAAARPEQYLAVLFNRQFTPLGVKIDPDLQCNGIPCIFNASERATRRQRMKM